MRSSLKFLAILTALTLASCTHNYQSSTNHVTKQIESKYQDDATFNPKSPNPAFQKKTTLCFDEAHHNLAVKRGRYQPVLNLLNSDGLTILQLSEKFNQPSLKKCDLLYISAALGADIAEKKQAAESAFSPNEIKAIKKWVLNGGGLYLATDHMPMGQAVEQLLNQFAVFGSLQEITDRNHPIAPLSEPGVFEISNSQLSETSPIIQGRANNEKIKNVYYFYGEAFRAPKGSDIFLKANPNAKIGEDEHNQSKSPNEYSALGVALKAGKGRIIAVGDGTVLTAKFDTSISEKTGINRPGSDNVQLALNMFRWLGKIY